VHTTRRGPHLEILDEPQARLGFEVRQRARVQHGDAHRHVGHPAAEPDDERVEAAGQLFGDRARFSAFHRCEVLVDGGVRRGLDIAIALALGARAVLVGRPIMWALASGGEAGVSRALEIVRDELERALGLLGAPSVADLDPSFLVAGGAPVADPAP
jgi:hypothetical protein